MTAKYDRMNHEFFYKEMYKRLKISHILFLSFIIVVGLFSLWPSFRLALTGDDYLTYWRYEYYLKKMNWSLLSFFFTDYGPQDTLFALIHHFFLFNPLPYFIISFILRLVASISFYPILRFITKNTYISLLGTITFLTSATGLETTNWVFNMPSYVSIALLNLFILSFIKLTNNFTLRHIFTAVVLFTLTLISQPIRMIFLPGFVSVFLLIWLTTNFIKEKGVKTPLILLATFISVFLCLFALTHIGDSVGVSTNFKERVSGSWFKNTEGINGISKEIKNKHFQIIIYPIAQIGNIIFPNQLISFEHGVVPNSYLLIKIVIPSTFVSLLILYLTMNKFVPKTKKYFLTNSFLLICWTLFVYIIFFANTLFPMQASEILSFLVGGYFLIYVFQFFIFSTKSNKKIIVISMLLMILPFIVPWIRFPNTIHETVGRYLIVPAAGFTLLLITLLSISRNKIVFIAVVIFPLILINIKASRKYLHNLAFVRESKRTEKIRSSLPILPTLSKNGETTLVYFEGDYNEVLYHSFMFGFPVIASYYQKVDNIWNVAYTQNWDEFSDAFYTGSSLKRFSTIPVKPVPLENIYSFKLDYDHLNDTTSETREKLKSL